MDKRLALLIKAWRAVEKMHGGPIRAAKEAAAKIPEERMALPEETEKVLSNLLKLSPERAESINRARYIAEQGRRTTPEMGLKGYLFGSSVVPIEKAPIGIGKRAPRDLDVYLTGTPQSVVRGPITSEEKEAILNMVKTRGTDIVYEQAPKGRTLGETGVELVTKGREKYPGTGYNMIRFLGLAPGIAAPLTLSDYLKQGEKE